MKLSIIIAAHNSEKTIAGTIESIKKQLCAEIEVLIVNDDSVDSTEEIIMLYKSKGIRIFSVSNSSVSATRNFGLMNAVGEYIWFVDADDFIENDSIKFILELIKTEKPDVIMANYSILQGGKKRQLYAFQEEKRAYNSHEEIGECCKHLLSNSSFDSAIWKNVFRRSFLVNNSIYFDKKIFMNEDGNWLFEVLVKSNSLISVNKSIYVYNLDSPTSVTKRKQTLSTYKCSNYVYSRWYKEFANAFPDQETNYLLKKRMSNGYANASVSIMTMDKMDRAQACSLFMDHIHVLDAADNRYGKLIKVGKITGYRFSLALANIVYQIMRKIKQ